MAGGGAHIGALHPLRLTRWDHMGGASLKPTLKSGMYFPHRVHSPETPDPSSERLVTKWCQPKKHRRSDIVDHPLAARRDAALMEG